MGTEGEHEQDAGGAMKPLKRILIGAWVTLAIGGLCLLACDAIYVRSYGVGFNDAAFFLGNGKFADWPTGERPLYAYFPLGAYGIAACLAAVLLSSLSQEIKRQTNRVLRGTE